VTIAPEATAAENDSETPSNWDISSKAMHDRFHAAIDATRKYPDTNDTILRALGMNTTLTVCTYVFNPAGTKTLLIKHPKFGWVPAGGHVEGEEHPRDAARRELHEEAGVICAWVQHRPVVCCYAFMEKQNKTLGMLGYAAFVDESHPLVAETDAAWFDLDDLPTSVFPDDPARIRQALADSAIVGQRFDIVARDHNYPYDNVEEHRNIELGEALRTWQRMFSRHIAGWEPGLPHVDVKFYPAV
jgi:ADP-ribose pyrophosphatase YjhB (NUDIX family)